MTWQELLNDATNHDDGVAIFTDKRRARVFYHRARKLGFDVVATQVPHEGSLMYRIYNLDVHSQKCVCKECKC